MPNSVELLGTYGGDESHALSAWSSTSRDLTEEKRGRIDKLLKMLAENGHHTPFEKSTLHFLVRCETASHIHLIKHRIGVSINAESARYRQISPSFYIPTDWPQAEKDKLDGWCQQAGWRYMATVADLEPLLGRQRAKESARFYLPYASQLTIDVSFNFRSFMHFQKLRNDSHAQKEIREIAQDMLQLVKQTWQFTHSLAGFGYA